ncbi:MAG: hypothetical protein KIT58_03120 [Planctomycetota bacterium]|nr:hypothetical protein [Planctomycetota bacterium]
MTIRVQDVPTPTRPTAEALWALRRRFGGSAGEAARRFEQVLESSVRERELDLGGVNLDEVGKLSLGGERWRQNLVDGRGRQFEQLESDGGQPITSDFFASVTGQVIFSEVRRAYELPDFYFSRAIPVTPSGILGTEVVPEIGGMGDVSQDMLESQAYEFVGFGPHTYTLPEAKKRGLGVAITEETLTATRLSGLTPFILEQAGRIGTFLGYAGELRRIDVVSGFLANYIRDGVGTDTYLASGAYANLIQEALVDYTDVNAAEQALNEVLDPDTGLPIARGMGSRTLIVMPSEVMRVLAFVGATEIRTGDITSGTGLQTVSGNPLTQIPLNVVSSQILFRRVLQTLEDEVVKVRKAWWYGDLSAFGWKEIWPLSVAFQGADSNAAFERDVVARWKARYLGEAFVREPRRIVHSQPDAWAL